MEQIDANQNPSVSILCSGKHLDLSHLELCFQQFSNNSQAIHVQPLIRAPCLFCLLSVHLQLQSKNHGSWSQGAGECLCIGR